MVVPLEEIGGLCSSGMPLEGLVTLSFAEAELIVMILSELWI
jgi:hypothetical protein